MLQDGSLHDRSDALRRQADGVIDTEEHIEITLCRTIGAILVRSHPQLFALGWAVEYRRNGRRHLEATNISDEGQAEKPGVERHKAYAG